MRLWMVAAAMAAIALANTARADQPRIGPSFDCAAVHSPGAQLICSSTDLARTDLSFVQTYYALRQQIGEAGWQGLKVEAVEFENRSLQRCGIPLAGPLPPDNTVMVPCLSARYERQRAIWLSRLSGPALEEAQRPVEQHIALQHDLQTLGFIPPTATIDGVYGAATRSAILAWQGARGMPATGLLGNQDSALLEQQATAATPSTPSQPHATTSERVPFVACQSDGQVGPRSGPKDSGQAPTIPQSVAHDLAYYASTDLGVLAPRGWNCFGLYGSGGSTLIVTPESHGATDLLSGAATLIGPAVTVSLSYHDTSGRFEVAQVAARLFPAKKMFVEQVIHEGVEPESNFPFGPYPNDILKRRGDFEVEFETPANMDGMGTRGRLMKKNADAISGLAIMTRDGDLLQLNVRTPPPLRNLIPTILESTLRQNSSNEAATQLAPSAASPPTGAIPPDIDSLINKWGELSDRCQGSVTPDDEATKISCDERDKLILQLNLRGWCFGTAEQSEAEKRWRQCPTPAAHIVLAVNALRQVQQELAASRIAAAQAYQGMALLRMGARNWLGCSGGTDNDCMNNTASAVAASNDAAAQGQWNTLWIAEIFREMAEDFIGKDLPSTQAKVDALGRVFGNAPYASEINLLSVAQSASESMALFAEIQGGVLMRKMGNDTLDNMARIQVSFHGAFASITEPGRRAALALLDAANLLDKAESEVNLATETLGVPSGHLLINTPPRHQ